MKNFTHFICLLIFVSTLYTACTESIGRSQQDNNQARPMNIKTGEDDDQPVYIQVAKKKNGTPANGVLISLIDVQSDTASATTDSFGIAHVQLQHPGFYYLNITSPVYVDVYDTITLTRPQTVRTDTLEVEPGVTP